MSKTSAQLAVFAAAIALGATAQANDHGPPPRLTLAKARVIAGR